MQRGRARPQRIACTFNGAFRSMGKLEHDGEANARGTRAGGEPVGTTDEPAREPTDATEASDRREGAATEAAHADALDLKLCFDVYATNLAFARVYAPLLEPHGLTYPQYLVLTLLWERDGRGVGEVGDVLDLKSSTLTPVLKRLEGAGLVTRTRESNDERRVRITLTSEGRAMRQTLRDVPACVEEATGLPEAEIRDLQTRLRTVRANLRAKAG